MEMEPASRRHPAEAGFGDLPLWRGIQKQPGTLQALPFALCRDQRGFLRQSSDQRVRQAVLDAYASEHYQFITPPPGTSAWADRLGGQKFQAVLDFLAPLDGLRVLEIGAGSTYVAERLFERFDIAEYVIVDPAIRARDARGGRLRILRDYFPAPALRESGFDVVLSFSCLEHVPDPIVFLREVDQALLDDGTLLLTFPDVGRQFARGDLNVLLHEHMSYLDIQGAAEVFGHAGFRPLRWHSEYDLFIFALAKAGPGAAWMAPETGAIELDELVASLDQATRRVSACLDGGRQVAFHGANNGLNIFLHALGAARADQALIFDGDAAKAGGYLPASASPIRAVGDPSYRQVDRVFISAMSFHDEIKSQLVRDQGIEAHSIGPLFGSTHPKAI